MAQRPIQDIIARKRHMPRAISRPKKTAHARVHSTRTHKKSHRNALPRTLKKVSSLSRGYSRKALWGAALLAVLLLVIAVSTFFESATLKISPKQKTFPLDGTFVASSKKGEGILSFELMTLKDQATKEISATEVERVDRRASGKIVIFNEYNSQPQRLIKNTRFETSDGLIYRIRDSVVVPGQHMEGGETVPGSIEVTVYADEPGEKYNIGLVDFTIPGFKGTPRFDSFYARSKTEMSGAFSGVVKTASEKDIEEAKIELQSLVTEKLLAAAQAQKPDGFILYQDALFIDMDSQGQPAEQQDVDQETVTVVQGATLYGILLDKKELSQEIAEELIPTLTEEEDVSVLNLPSLEFSIQEKESFDPTEDADITFTLRGEPKIVWLFDEDALVSALQGKPKDSIQSVLSGFPSITKAEVTLRPFWRRSFPENPRDITIEQIIE